MLITKIVTDYDTSKKAQDIGLRIKCNADWCKLVDNNISIHTKLEQALYSESREHIEEILCPAPTVEEVPLPIGITFKIGGTRPTNCFRARVYSNRIEFSSNISSALTGHIVFYDTVVNEATARLKMVIWLIENIKEVKQWYKNKGYF